MSVKQGGKTIAGATQYHPDLFDFKWADHILDDAQWLMANPFSWQYGSMYQAAYANLSAAIAGKTLQSETVAGITVQFYLADDGHKICPASEEDKVLSIYNKTGNAWYYIIDTTNQRFKLPRRHSQQIVRSVKNADGSWYRLYADGWVEQGCSALTNISPSGVTLSLPVTMSQFQYMVMLTPISYSGDGIGVSVVSRTENSFIAKNKNYGSSATVPCLWQVSGQSAIDMSSFQGGEKYLYFYVGAFTQTAIENTAGLNTELFNQKADLNLSNVASNIDFVVESQEPTAANGYTWYRKYKSGWVEQGGTIVVGSSNQQYTISLPCAMATTEYTLLRNSKNTGISDYASYIAGYTNKTTTNFSFYAVGSYGQQDWCVYGLAA